MQRQAKGVKERARAWIEPVARIGYLAKGIVYLMIGVMAILFATGQRSRPGDFGTVLVKVSSEPFGRLLVAVDYWFDWLRLVVFCAGCFGHRE